MPILIILFIGDLLLYAVIPVTIDFVNFQYTGKSTLLQMWGHFILSKEILGTDEAFEKLGLDPDGTYSFKLNFKALEPNENEEYVDINAVISNKGTTVVKLPVGSYLITEADDNYFDFVDIVSTMDPEIIVDGVTFEKTEQGYVITVTDDVQDDSFYTLKVTNEIEPERHYEETDSEINLFNATPVVEEQSLLQKFFSLFE